MVKEKAKMLERIFMRALLCILAAPAVVEAQSPTPSPVVGNPSPIETVAPANTCPEVVFDFSAFKRGEYVGDQFVQGIKFACRETGSSNSCFTPDFSKSGFLAADFTDGDDTGSQWGQCRILDSTFPLAGFGGSNDCSNNAMLLLGSPSSWCPPGTGYGYDPNGCGAPDSQFPNCYGEGLVLIGQEGNIDCIAGCRDAEVQIEFEVPTYVFDVTVIDTAEANTIELFDDGGNLVNGGNTDMVQGCDNGLVTTPLGYNDVQRMVIAFGARAALARVRYTLCPVTPDPTPAPVSPSPTTPSPVTRKVCEELTKEELTILDETQALGARNDYFSSVLVPEGSGGVAYTVTIRSSEASIPDIVYLFNSVEYRVAGGDSGTHLIDGVLVVVGAVVSEVDGTFTKATLFTSDWNNDGGSVTYGLRLSEDSGVIDVDHEIVITCTSTPSPSSTPTDMPSTTPTDMPTKQKKYMESLVVASVGSSWKPLSLSAPFLDPVAVCNPHYDGSSNSIAEPTLVRMRMVSGGFEVRLQQPGVDTVTFEKDVHCLVVEKGAFTTQLGHKIEAQSYGSTVTDRKNNWNGEQQSYLQSYAEPVVVGQVMTSVDSSWSVFWCHGGQRNISPSSNKLYTGKLIGEDTTVTRLDEVVGFIVMETASAPLAYEAAVGARIVRGVDNLEADGPFTYVNSLGQSPAVVVADMAGMTGKDGGWVNVEGQPTANTVRFVIDEDQIRDSERRHLKEYVSYIAFAGEGVHELVEQ